MNSIGISILIEIIEEILNKNGRLAFSNLTPTVAKTFKIMGLTAVCRAFRFRTNRNSGVQWQFDRRKPDRKVSLVTCHGRSQSAFSVGHGRHGYGPLSDCIRFRFFYDRPFFTRLSVSSPLRQLRQPREFLLQSLVPGSYASPFPGVCLICIETIRQLISGNEIRYAMAAIISIPLATA